MVGDQQTLPQSALAAPAFVGRERDVEALGQALSRPPAVILVEAEPGAGKSRLVQELLSSAVGRQHRLLVAVCPPFREALTLGPVVDAVRRARDGVADLRLSGLAGALRPLLPEWAEQLPPALAPLDDAKAARHRLFRAFAELIRTVGTTGLVLEDAHWADPVTLEFLLFLVAHRTPGRSPDDPPSLVVTYRPADVAVGSPLARLPSRVPAGTTRLRLALTPLDPPQIARMVSSMLGGGPVSAEFAQFLYEQTGGVPLAVEESVRLLCDRADLVRRNGEWVRRRLAELRISPTIRDSVLERVQRLSRPARDVLQAAAVLAEPTPEETLARVAGLAAATGPAPPAVGTLPLGEPLPAAVREAVASGLVHRDGQLRLAYRHAFMGQAVYEAIPGAERRRLHRLAGEALERLDPPPAAALTRHFREADQRDRWRRYAGQAAERAVAGGDHTTATALLVEVLAAAEPPTAEQVRLGHRLATITLGRREPVDDLHQQVVDALRRVLRHPEIAVPDRAELRHLLGRLLAQQGDLSGAQRELEQAIRHLRHDTAEAGRVMTYLGWPWLGPWPASVHREWLRRAASVDYSGLPTAVRVSLLADRAVALLQLGEPEGWAVAGQVPATADGDPAELRRQRSRAYLNLGTAATLWGHYDRARQWFADGLALADAEAYPRILSKIALGQVELAWLCGEWTDLAARLAALSADDSAEPLVALNVTRLQGWWHLVDGSPRRAEEIFGAALREARQIGSAEDELDLAAGLGRIFLAEGRVCEALHVTEEPLAPVVAKQVWLFATTLAPVRVAALAAAGRLAEAEELVTAYRQGVGGWGVPAADAGLASCQAVLAEARGEPAADLFAEAAVRWRRLPRPYEALSARERQARCLIAAGAQTAGQELLTTVWQGLSTMGARADEERVGRQLREYGVEVRRPWRGGRRGYGHRPSPRELEVIELVLAGKTNREIAHQLRKSPRTVAGQLASVMRKLGVSSRTELAVRAVEEGLVPEEGARPVG